METFTLPKGVYRLGQTTRLQRAPDAAPDAPLDAPAAAFPFGLGREGVHEICEAHYGDKAAAAGFALAAMAHRPGPIVWVSDRRARQEHGALFNTGLHALHTSPPPILHVDVAKPRDALWAIEEAVCSGVAAAVFGEVDAIDFTASRRLRLASMRSGAPLILLTSYMREGSTAACARWRVQAAPSTPNPFDPHAPGAMRWGAVLERCRAAPEMSGAHFTVEMNDETLSLSVAPRLAADAPAPRPARASDGDVSILQRTG